MAHSGRLAATARQQCGVDRKLHRPQTVHPYNSVELKTFPDIALATTDLGPTFSMLNKEKTKTSHSISTNS